MSNNDLIQARIKNGACGFMKGWRQIVVSPSGVIRPVQSLKHAPNSDEDATYQLAEVGDYVIRNEYYPHNFHYKRWNGVKFTILSKFEVPIEIVKAREPLREWLTRVGKQASVLPKGWGWDGVNTGASLKKEQRMRTLFKGVDESILREWIHRANCSKREGMPFIWAKDAIPLPKVYPSIDSESKGYVLRCPFKSDPVLETLKPGEKVPNDTRSMIIIEEYSEEHLDRVQWVLFRRMQ